MFHVRTVKTSSGATAVQIVKYEKRKRIIVSHIGSAHTEKDLTFLKQEALKQVEHLTKQKSLFPSSKNTFSPVIVVNKSQYLGDRHTFIYDTLFHIFRLFQFNKLNNQLLLDLVLMRIIKPVSKLESLQILSEMFGKEYGKSSLYQALTSFPKLKDSVEKTVVSFTKEHYAFDFSIVFYDVTTLYFESFREDTDTTDTDGNVIEKGLRQTGFSKDNKSNQPQIVIGLIVNKDGFPVSYEVFAGNTFEGDTFIPLIYQFKKTYAAQTLTVVADAAMISLDNIEKLKECKLSYIVGARVANLSPSVIKQISDELKGVDGISGRVQTDKGMLVYDFSLNRYEKDKREMGKQIVKAQRLVEKNTEGKRTKFLKLKNTKKDKKEKVYELNTALIEKTKYLLGIKGYYTNLTHETDKTIIDQYHNLWYVEKAFRIAKSDLAMRPIFHFKKQAIEAHILICFMALAVCKYMELETGKSTRKIVKLLGSITEARILNKLTGEITTMRKELTVEIEKLRKTLTLSH